jgi:hypothetical protein
VLGRFTDALAEYLGGKGPVGIPANLAPIVVLCLGYPAAAPEAVIRERPSIIWTPAIAAPTGQSN